MSYALRLAAVAIAILVAGVLAILIFDAIWFRIGFGGALVIVCGSLLLFAWLVDRRDRAARAELDELPPV
jgi:bacteriorhodopsin